MTVDEDRAGRGAGRHAGAELARAPPPPIAPSCWPTSEPTWSRSSRQKATRPVTRGPFPPERASVETSGRFLYLGTGKQSVVVDPADPADSERLAGCSRKPTWSSTTAPGPEVDRRSDRPGRPGGVVLDHPVRPDRPVRRLSGRAPEHRPRRGRGPGTAGWVGWTLHPERPPVQIGSDMAHFDAGANAAIAVLAAYHRRQRPVWDSASTSRRWSPRSGCSGPGSCGGPSTGSRSTSGPTLTPRLAGCSSAPTATSRSSGPARTPGRPCGISRAASASSTTGSGHWNSARPIWTS